MKNKCAWCGAEIAKTFKGHKVVECWRCSELRSSIWGNPELASTMLAAYVIKMGTQQVSPTVEILNGILTRVTGFAHPKPMRVQMSGLCPVCGTARSQNGECYMGHVVLELVNPRE